jgi:hypothetical protein
LEALEGLG